MARDCMRLFRCTLPNFGLSVDSSATIDFKGDDYSLAVVGTLLLNDRESGKQ